MTKKTTARPSVTICGKTYIVPEIDIRKMVELENMGYSVLTLADKRNPRLNSMACMMISLCQNVDIDDASDVLIEHVAAGGELMPLVETLLKCMETDEYFTKALAQKKDVEKNATKGATATATES